MIGGLPPRWNWEVLEPDVLLEAWKDLVRWVNDVVLDRNELEDALPWCWPHHRTLVAELVALREWHSEIYESGQGGPQAVLEWRDELLRASARWPRPCDPQAEPQETVRKHREMLRQKTRTLLRQHVPAEVEAARKRLNTR